MQLLGPKLKEMIYPSSPSPSPSLSLSNNDQIMPRLYTSTLFFFINPQSTADHTKLQRPVTHLLKSSLTRALAVFYPLAGRFKERDNGGVDVDCGNQGVPFWEAWVDAGLSIFEDFQPNAKFGLLRPDVVAAAEANIVELPLLLVQITHFACGGISLGVALHHHVCDGVSFSHFMKSWAELALDKGLSLHPYLDRSMLKAREPPSPSFPHVEYRVGKPILPSSFPEMTARMFPFTNANVDALREMAGRSYTSFECLAGHLWRCVTRARGIVSSQEVRLGMATDGRKRLNPPLPEGFFGNVNFYGCAISRAGDLVEKPLGYAAGLVHKAIARITDEYMRSALDFIEKQGSPTCVVPGFDSFLGSDLAITSWARFSLYEVDFGWGKPTFVGIPAHAFDGLVVMLPSGGEGCVNAVLGLAVEHMKVVEADMEFLP